MNKPQKIYGLLGKKLSHSFSKNYFTDKFIAEKIENCFYQNFEIKKVEEFIQIIASIKNIYGLNVTIPYKESILPFLDELSDNARQIGAVNTIKFENGKTIGHNTDVIGFEKSLLPLLKKHHHQALILGTGGAAKAVEFVLKKLKISYQYVSRNKTKNTFSYEDLTKEILDKHTVIINTTPLGMHPDVDTYPNIPFEFLNESHLVYDLIYNPAETRLMALAKERGATVKNGLEMLQIQAEESWKIWNS
jgi:shikimate dehydrogenase